MDEGDDSGERRHFRCDDERDFLMRMAMSFPRVRFKSQCTRDWRKTRRSLITAPHPPYSKVILDPLCAVSHPRRKGGQYPVWSNATRVDPREVGWRARSWLNGLLWTAFLFFRSSCRQGSCNLFLRWDKNAAVSALDAAQRKLSQSCFSKDEVRRQFNLSAVEPQPSPESLQ